MSGTSRSSVEKAWQIVESGPLVLGTTAKKFYVEAIAQALDDAGVSTVDMPDESEIWSQIYSEFGHPKDDVQPVSMAVVNQRIAFLMGVQWLTQRLGLGCL
jgi:hypothetical protein